MQHLNRGDQLYLARACELAARGIGNVSPNPPVGAVVVARDGRIIGEGFHHRRGEAHAEVEALREVHRRGRADALSGATMYVSLEPCNHHGRTPPCSEAVAAAGLARVVVGALDPNPRTALGGVTRLEADGVAVDIVNDAWAHELIRQFARAVRLQRPYVTLKLATSLDGRIAPTPGSFWLTGAEAREFVHDLRHEHDAVLVGAHTAAIDDPLLTVRPPRVRLRACTRVIVCGATPPPREARIFAEAPMTTTLLLVPGAFAEAYAALADQAEIAIVGDTQARWVDLVQALAILYEREIGAVLCEGGPVLAAAFLDVGLVDRIEWLLTPRILAHEHAVPALPGSLHKHIPKFRFDQVSRLGDDLRLTIDLP